MDQEISRVGYGSMRSFSPPPNECRLYPSGTLTPGLNCRRHLHPQPTSSRLKHRRWHHHQRTASSPRPHLNPSLRRPRPRPHAPYAEAVTQAQPKGKPSAYRGHPPPKGKKKEEPSSSSPKGKGPPAPPPPARREPTTNAMLSSYALSLPSTR